MNEGRSMSRQWSDEDFCRHLGLADPFEKRLCQIIRNVTAQECKVAKESIAPDTETQVLANRTVAGWDNLAVLMSIEQELGVALTSDKLPNFTLERFFMFWKSPPPANYGEWVAQVVRYLIPQIESQRKQKAQSD